MPEDTLARELEAAGLERVNERFREEAEQARTAARNFVGLVSRDHGVADEPAHVFRAGCWAAFAGTRGGGRS